MFNVAGGFSNYHKPPAYQQKAVSEYLATHNTLPYYIANAHGTNIGENGGVYNRAGRGYPDVSANGAFLLAYNNLTRVTYFGTSKSTVQSRSKTNLNRTTNICFSLLRSRVSNLCVRPYAHQRRAHGGRQGTRGFRQSYPVRAPVRAKRHHQRLQSQLRVFGLSSGARLGSSDRSGNTELSQDAEAVAQSSVRRWSRERVGSILVVGY